MTRPDACKLPSHVKVGTRLNDRAVSAVVVAERLLGVDYDRGERAWVREMGRGRLFATRDPHDCLFVPSDADRGAGGPRYRWEKAEGDDGIELGYLLEAPDGAG